MLPRPGKGTGVRPKWDKLPVRPKWYKLPVGPKEDRRSRHDSKMQTGGINPNRDEPLRKKRKEGVQAQPLEPADHASAMEKKLESLPAMVAGVYSDDGNLQLEAMTDFRMLLSIVCESEPSSPIEKVIESGVVPRFVEFLEKEDSPQLQFEAAWALTNIASSTSKNTQVVILNGAVPIFVQLLNSLNDDFRELAMWALGNVAGDSEECRDLVMEYGALVPLLNQLNVHAKPSMLRIATWTLCNLCRGNPKPRFETIKPSLPRLKWLLSLEDEEVLSDTCWALSYFSDGTDDKIQAVIEAGVCPQLVNYLRHTSHAVLIPALRTIAHIVTGGVFQTQYIIDLGSLPIFLNLLTHVMISIKKEAFWIISNITAGNTVQIQAVIDAGIIAPLVDELRQPLLEGIQLQAAWAISNATYGGTRGQIRDLVNRGCIEPLCYLLRSNNAEITLVCLNCLEKILKVGAEEHRRRGFIGLHPYALMLLDAEGLVNLQSVCDSIDFPAVICNKAANIRKTYLPSTF